MKFCRQSPVSAFDLLSPLKKERMKFKPNPWFFPFVSSPSRRGDRHPVSQSVSGNETSTEGEQCGTQAGRRERARRLLVEQSIEQAPSQTGSRTAAACLPASKGEEREVEPLGALAEVCAQFPRVPGWFACLTGDLFSRWATCSLVRLSLCPPPRALEQQKATDAERR